MNTHHPIRFIWHPVQRLVAGTAEGVAQEYSHTDHKHHRECMRREISERVITCQGLASVKDVLMETISGV